MLRPFEPADADVVERNVSRVEFGRMMAIPHPYPEGGAAAWIATTKPGREFAIELRETGELVGGIAINHEHERGRAQIGYWCAIEHWGRGYATEAVRAVIDHAFRDLGVNRVHARCYADNPASRRVLEKAGMTHEGTLRQHSFRVDRFADELLFGILRSEWKG